MPVTRRGQGVGMPPPLVRMARMGLIVLVTLLAACAQPGALAPRRPGGAGATDAADAANAAPAANLADAPAPLAWPGPPEPARISWERSISRPADLGLTRSFLQRLGDLLFGAPEERMVRPMAVVALDRVLFVADPGVRGVHRFDPVAGTYRLLRLEDGRELPSPVGLARCGSSVVVSDSSRGELLVVDATTDYARVVPLPERSGQSGPAGRPERPSQPTGVACDATGARLFVSDTAGHRILTYRRVAPSAPWLFDHSFGTRGGAPGEFNYPTYLWWDGARLLVSDSLNFRVQAFDPDGRFLSVFGGPGDGAGDSARPKGVATDSAGHVYVVDALFHAFQIFDRAGQLLLGVGARGSGPGEFWLPTGISIERDEILVADSYNSRVQVFRYHGGEP